VVLRDNRGERSVAPAPTSVRPTQSTTTATPPPSTVGPWEATPVGGGAAGEVPLLGTGDSLYARDDRGIVRIDPGTGRVVARRDYPVAGGLTDAVLAAGVLWVSPTSKADGTATLQGFEPATLAPSASVRLRFNGPSGVASLAAAPDGRRLYAALGNTIDVVDTTTLQVVNQYAVSGGYVLDVAVNADGTRLYVAVHVAEMDARIDVLDAASGTPIMTRNHAGNIVNNIGLVASAGGLWLQTGGGDERCRRLPRRTRSAADGHRNRSGNRWPTDHRHGRKRRGVARRAQLDCLRRPRLRPRPCSHVGTCHVAEVPPASSTSSTPAGSYSAITGPAARASSSD